MSVNKNTQACKAVITDFDGTVLDSGPEQSMHRLEPILNQYGFVLDAGHHARAREAAGRPGRSFMNHIFGAVPDDLCDRVMKAWEDLDHIDPQDSAPDILAGQAAGIRTVAVETGGYRSIHAKAHPVDERDVIPSIADLPKWINEHCSSPRLAA